MMPLVNALTSSHNKTLVKSVSLTCTLVVSLLRLLPEPFVVCVIDDPEVIALV